MILLLAAVKVTAFSELHHLLLIFDYCGRACRVLNRTAMKLEMKKNVKFGAFVSRRGFVGATLVAGVYLAGCGGQKSAQNGVGASNELVIISPHGLEIKNEFERVFKAKNPGVTFKWIDKGASSDALRFVQSQFKGKSGEQGIGIDCFFGGGAETFLELDNDGDLQALPEDYGIPAALNGVPLRGKDNHWVGAALSGFGILMNTAVIERDKLPRPTNWAGLGDPKLRNRIALADPRHSGSAHAAYEIILQTNGWDEGWNILTRMTANTRSFARSASDLPQAVSSGEAAMAPAIDFYARAAIERAGKDKLSYIVPQGQSVVTPDPIGILRGAPNPELAKKWVAFVMSPEAQQLWMLPKGSTGGPQKNTLFRQAALPSVYKKLPSNLNVENPYQIQNARSFDADKAAKRRRALDDLIGAVLIDNREMIATKLGANPNLGYVPLSEAELDVAAAKWDDAAFRAQTTAKWGEAARKYFG